MAEFTTDDALFTVGGLLGVTVANGDGAVDGAGDGDERADGVRLALAIGADAAGRSGEPECHAA